ncbi:MAG: DHHW family protein [Bacillota bacterium]|nr:DHHW family protein [Bacillota bacterium]
MLRKAPTPSPERRARCAALLPALLAVFVLAWMLLRSPSLDYSDSEKRPLAAFPRITAAGLVDGSVMADIDTWMQDRFPFRSFLVGLNTASRLALGEHDNGRVYFGSDSHLFLYENEPLQNPADTRRTRLAEANMMELEHFLLETLPAALPTARRSLIIVPPAAAVLPECVPAAAPLLDSAAWTRRFTAPLENTDIHILPTLDVLTATPDGGPADLETRSRRYFASDHHWTSLGAFVTARAWLGSLGLDGPEAANFAEIDISSSFRGSLEARAQRLGYPGETLTLLKPTAAAIAAGLEPDPDRLELRDFDGALLGRGLYDYEQLGGSDEYLVYLGGNPPVTVIETGCPTGRSLLLIKDSFANSIVPFLLSNFERITLVDARHGSAVVRDALERSRPDDVLVLYSLSQLLTDETLHHLNPR